MNSPSSSPGFNLTALPELAPVQIDAAYWSLYFDEISYLEAFPLKELSRKFNWPLETLARSASGLKLTPLSLPRAPGGEAWLPQSFWADLKQGLAWAESLGPGGVMASGSLGFQPKRLPGLNQLVDALRHYQSAPDGPAGKPGGGRNEKELKLLAVWLLSVLNQKSLDNALRTVSQMENNLWAQLRGEPEGLPEGPEPSWARLENMPPGLAAKVLAAWFRLAADQAGQIGAFLIRDPVFTEALPALGPPPSFLTEVRPGQGGLAPALAWLGSASPDAPLAELRAGLENRLTAAPKDHYFPAKLPALKIFVWPGPEQDAGGFKAVNRRMPLAAAAE